MDIVLLLAAVGAATGLVTSWQTRRQRKRKRSPFDPGRESLRAVRKGDVVAVGSDDHVVESIVRYQEEGHAYRLATLESGGGEQRFLYVEDRDDGRAWLLSAIAIDLGSTPSRQLERNGFLYRLAGDAQAEVGGPSMTRATPGRCRCARWQGPGGRLIFAERLPEGSADGSDARTWAGEGGLLEPGLLKVLPGS
jgi:hypothetical protein